MKISALLPTAADGIEAASILSAARDLEALGLHGLYLHDHLVTPVDLESAYPYSVDGSYHHSPERPFYDCVPVLAALAVATERVRLGTLVMIPAYRHPIPLAKELATIDQLSGGRLVLGVGAGWMDEEFEALGLPTGGKAARLDEHIAMMRNAWQHGVAAWDGDRYGHPALGFHPQPAQDGHTIPVILGGHGDRTLERVARWADGWAVAAPGDEVAERGSAAIIDRIVKLQRFCEQHDRDFEELRLIGLLPDDTPFETFEGMAMLGVEDVALRTMDTPERAVERIAAWVDQHGVEVGS